MVDPLRPLESGELEQIAAAEELFRHFGSQFPHTIAFGRARNVEDAARDLLSAIKQSHGEVNQADVNRVHWMLAEFSKHIASWVENSAGVEHLRSIADEVSQADAVRDCLAIAAGEAFGIALEPEQSGATNLILTGLDPANPERRINALGLLGWAIAACEPLAWAALLAAEEDLKAAATRLLMLQVEVLWGAPMLASFAESAVRLPGTTVDFRPRPIAFAEIPRVLAACELARRRQAQSGALAPSAIDGLAEPPTGDASTVSPLNTADGPGPDAEPVPLLEMPSGEELASSSSEETRAQDTTQEAADNAPPPGSSAQPLDVAAMLAEAVAVAELSEQRWSMIQGPELLRQIQELEGRAASVLRTIQMKVEAQAVEGPVVPLAFPMSSKDANSLVGDSSDSIPERQSALASVLVVQDLVAAMLQLKSPTKTSINLGTYNQVSWWSPEAFARVRTAATLAMEVIAKEDIVVTDPTWWCLNRAQLAWRAGLVDATLLYLLASIDQRTEVDGALGGALAALRDSVDHFLDTGTSVPSATVPIALFWLGELSGRLSAPPSAADQAAVDE